MKRTHLAAPLLAALALGACAKEESARSDRAASPPPPPPPAIGGTGSTVGGGLLPPRDNGPVDPGEVGGMRSNAAVPPATANSPRQ